ncbi:MAG: FecR domain-containing protein [Elusimicrobia bacterium]|nr:FecR domain-containing protein [Elusimicrobiota bacterium]
MRSLVLLALLLAGPVRAADPAPFADEIARLELQRTDLERRLASRQGLLAQASAKPSASNIEAAQLLRKAVSDTRESLAVVAASLRKLREFGEMLAKMRLKPKAVFGASSVKGEVTLITKDGSRPLTAGSAIEEPGIITTGDGAANILLPDGTSLTLGPHSRFDTKDWTLHSGELYYESLDALFGKARAAIRGKFKKFEVRTPSCVTSVRGTKFQLSAAALTLFDGEVETSTSAPAAAPAYSGQAPEPGAVVETGPGETRALSLPGGLSAVLGPESRLEASKSGKPVAFLRRGSARLRARCEGEPAQVLVPNARAQASSADWSMRVLPSGAAELSLEAGSVLMTADEKRLDAAALERWWDARFEEP